MEMRLGEQTLTGFMPVKELGPYPVGWQWEVMERFCVRE